VQIKHLWIAMAVMIVLAGISGCATERHIAPTLSDSPRSGLDLKPPILFAVFDGRASQKPKDAAAQLQEDLKRIYGSSIEWSNRDRGRWCRKCLTVDPGYETLWICRD